MKLIDKDAVVSIIKHHIKEVTHGYFCKCLLSEIDTIEVKEVDLENIAAAEWDDYIRKIDGEPNNAYMLIERNEYINLAKHFFELGLKTQKG